MIRSDSRGMQTVEEDDDEGDVIITTELIMEGMINYTYYPSNG